MAFSSRLVRRATALLAAVGTITAFVVAVAPAAVADPGPITQRDSSTGVTADGLPTAQIDGVVWSQVVVGDTVYAGGSFGKARPAGSPLGSNEVVRNNLLSYNIKTGVLNSSFAPSLNAQVLSVVASPDGSRIYVGGDFTTADGQKRDRIAAYSTSTGQLISTFHPDVYAEVTSIAATNTTVYAGGSFGSVGGTTRTRLAAFSAGDGSLLGWAPTADAIVKGMVLTPDGTRLIIGGQFQNVNGAPAYGLAALDPTTGTAYPYAVSSVVQDAGANAALTSFSISADGSTLFGVGYVYGAGGNFEGTFAVDPDSGRVKWLEDCHGDTYGAYGVNNAVYVVSHEHFCSNDAAFPDTNPRSRWQRTTAFTANATGTLLHNSQGGYADFGGQPSPSQINWYPTLTTGTKTGATQAAWTVTGNSSYIVEGGEFPKVNGVAQQGLVRFAIPSLAPKKQGPQVTYNDFVPHLLAYSNTSVRVSWQQNWDRDDQNLVYSVFRDKSTTPIYTSAPTTSHFWNLTGMGYLDSGLTAGQTYTYHLTATDPDGNVIIGANATITAPTNFSLSAYAKDVLNDGASSYWRLDETSGATATDWAGYNNLIEGSGVTDGAAGAIGGDSDTAATFSGDSNGTAGSTNLMTAPNVFTAEAWIKTTTTSGGKIIGFGNQQNATSGNYDRHVYMDNAGHLIFGVYPGSTQTAASVATYNDGQWHQVVAEMSSAGMALYVDGKVVATNGTTSGQPYSGYWRVGGDILAGWPSQPSSDYFAGAIDEAAVYPTALTATQIRQHYTDSGRILSVPAAPTDAYGKAVYSDDPTLFWRLDDANGPTAVDSSANGNNGVYAGGVTYQTPSTVTTAGTAATFNGSNGTAGSASIFNNPTVYSEEAWFKTTTTHGGKIIGFGDAQSGNSGNYDRHVYMINNGQLVFGTYTGQINLAQSTASYNDGQWHQVVASQSGNGMKLYVDGALVATNPQTQAQDYSGYWRVGGDSDWAGDSAYFAGSIDEVAVYDRELTATQVQAHYKASSAAGNVAPKAAFTASSAGLTAHFDATASTDSDGTVASYAWNFGDGATASGATVDHAYSAAGSYVVTLTVTDNQGATNTTTQTVAITAPVNAAPTAAFTTSCTNLACAFTGTGSSDPDGTVRSYSWSFGDSTAATGASPSHTYAVGGTYPVTLTVTDDQGATNSVSHTVVVAANKAPVASLATPSCAGLTCTLDASKSADPDGSVASYAFDFGDNTTGAKGSSATASHTFAAAGTYTVTLTVTDNQGATNSTTATVSVAQAANQPPSAAFTFGCTQLACTFDGTGSKDPDGTVANYSWAFGDGVSGAGATTSHTYATAGTYNATLTVTDNGGATNSVSQTVTVAAAALVSDTFNRTVAGGLGTADVGGAWSTVGTASKFSVSPGAAAVQVAAGAGLAGYLNIAGGNTDSTLDFAVNKTTAGSGTYVWLAARHQSGNTEYRLRTKITNTGVMQLTLTKTTSGTDTALLTKTITGLTFAPGTVYRMRFDVVGTSTVTLNGKLWAAGTTEPSTWQVSASDTSSTIPAGGSGFVTSTSSTETNAPMTVSLSGLRVVAA